MALPLACEPANAQEMYHLPLQREGQASVTIDDQSRTAFIVDLGKSGDGNQVVINGKPLVDFVALEKKVENFVVACSHPHADHMGGIEALFKNAKRSFYFDGDLSKPKFKSITVIDDGVSNSLAKLYESFAKSVDGRTDIKFTRIAVTDAAGRPGNAYRQLADLQKALTIENVAYDRKGKAKEHGRSIVTLTRFKDGPVIADFDDADSAAIRSAVDKLKASGINKIDVFVVPHHGSKYHDISPILELNPHQAIIAVNPNNRFGHPTSPILARLMKGLGAENVIFTGSLESVVIDKGGVRPSMHTAANRDSYALFVEHARSRVEKQAPSKAKAEELALFDEIRTMMFKAPPESFGPGTSPIPPSPSPNRPSGGAGSSGGGGATEILDARLASHGSILTPGFEAGYLPPRGMPAQDLKKNRPFSPATSQATQPVAYVSVATEEAARAPVALATAPANTAVRYLSPTGLDSAVVPTNWSVPGTSTTARKQNALPDGGMVYLNGGAVTLVGNDTSLVDATVDTCGTRVCLRTPKISFELPFGDVQLFKEVWHRVSVGVDAFYLSINPRNEYLKDPARFKDIPAGRMRFGSGVPMASDGAMNEVVTAGGIARSRIGMILWDADVAFKSAALGVDAKSGTKSAAYASVGAEEGEAGNVQADLAVGTDNRWCRLYWTSGSPRLVLNTASKRVVFSGDAVVAKSEAMKLVAGDLRPYAQGTWCQREKRLAARLQREANTTAQGSASLQRLRELSQMQAFAVWAKARNLAGTPAIQWNETQSGSAAVPTWTSGIRSAPVFQVQVQRSKQGGNSSHAVHMHFDDGKTYIECFAKPWRNVDVEWRALGLRKEGDAWQITSSRDSEAISNWLTAFASKVARCGNGVLLPTLTVDGLGEDDAFEGTSTIGPVQHVMSSQIHGGVLLAMLAERNFAEAFEPEAALWSPAGSLFLRRQAGEVSFWSVPPVSSGAHAVAQRIVFSDAKITEIRADEGKVRIALSTAAGSIVRKETRAKAADPVGPGLEVLEAYHASTGDSVLQKAVRSCPAGETQEHSQTGCLQRADMSAKEALHATFKDEAPPQVAVMRMVGDGVWVVELDMRHVQAAIDEQWKAGDQKEINHALHISRSYALWGFRVEAASILIQASKDISAESQDTILLAQVLRMGDGVDPAQWRRLNSIVRELFDIERGLKAKTVTADAAATRISKLSATLDLPTMRVDGLLMGLASDISESIAVQVRSAIVRERMTALAKSWKIKAQTLAALDAGILDEE
ncbi:hypothetical protein [Sphaerotilus mobilis]|uniref:hypothetical protein n=1 Tax=Sphaerotilus mobilis TaxID=47994 RepID=UPI00102BC5F4|nr:hypothetical protein [Sphaerotilus mobilis]